ncbi:hypothetical protein PJI16_00780 [Nitrospira sp. MA-1]|nr:hypothetical protein [Nitrospira sp. MA-1]
MGLKMDRLKTVLQQLNRLSALRSEWLDLSVERRTRYETFNQSFTKGTAESDQMVAQRTRILLGIENIWNPIRFTLNSQLFGLLWLIVGRITNPILSIIWIFFNSILIWCTRIFCEQEAQAALKSAV